jgi:hypothetical protein
MGSDDRHENDREAWERVHGEGSAAAGVGPDDRDADTLPAADANAGVADAQQADPRLTEAE